MQPAPIDGFAGLEWQNIDFEAGLVEVTCSKSKTSSRRHVIIRPGQMPMEQKAPNHRPTMLRNRRNGWGGSDGRATPELLREEFRRTPTRGQHKVNLGSANCLFDVSISHKVVHPKSLRQN